MKKLIIAILILLTPTLSNAFPPTGGGLQGGGHTTGPVTQEVRKLIHVKTVDDSASGMNVDVVQGHFLYLAGAASTDNFEIWDIEDRENPIKLSSISDTNMANGKPHDMVVFGNYVLVSSISATYCYFTVIDVTNKKNPVIVNQIDDTVNKNYWGQIHAMTIVGDILWVKNRDSVKDGWLRAWRLSDVITQSAPSPLGQVQIGSNHNSATGGIVSDGRKYMYVTFYYGTSLTVVDISNPTAPTIVSTRTDSDFGSGDNIALRGKYLYMPLCNFDRNWHDGITIVDVSNPDITAAAKYTAYQTTLQVADDLKLIDNYAILAYEDSNKYLAGLSVVDVSDPTNPRFKYFATIPSPDLNGTRNLAIIGQYIYTSHKGHVYVYKLPGLSTPAANIGNLDVDWARVSQGLKVNQRADISGSLNVAGNALFMGDLAVMKDFVIDESEDRVYMFSDSAFDSGIRFTNNGNTGQIYIRAPSGTYGSMTLSTVDANRQALGLLAGTGGSLFEFSDIGFFGIAHAPKNQVGAGAGIVDFKMYGDGSMAANKKIAMTPQSTTLSSTALALTNGSVLLTCSGNALTTITGGRQGDTVILKFQDACTVTDDDTAAADTLNINETFQTFAAGDTLSLYYDGTSWYETAHSDNTP